MAVTTEQFNADGTLTDFTVPSEILSKSHVRVDFYYDALDHEITAEQWDVFGSTVVFATAPTNGYVVKITTSTDGSGLDTPSSVISDVAAIAADIQVLADNIEFIQNARNAEYIVNGLPLLAENGDLAVNVIDGGIYEWQVSEWVLIAQSATDTGGGGTTSTGVTVVSSLPASGVQGEIFFNQADGLYYAYIDGEMVAFRSPASAVVGIQVVDTVTGVTGEVVGEVVFASDNKQFMEWDGTSWIEVVQPIGAVATIGDGTITAAKMASGLELIENVGTLPAVDNFVGRIAYLTTDGKLYRYTASGWTAEVSTQDLTGTIGATQITDAAITTAKLAVGAVTADTIGANAIVAGKISANAVTSGTISAGVVGATEIAANAITATKIAAGAIEADKLAANSVTAVKLAAGSITSDKLTANCVTAGAIAASSVDANKIAANSINATHITAGSITADKIGAYAVTADKLDTNAIIGKRIEMDSTQAYSTQYFSDSIFGSQSTAFSFINTNRTYGLACHKTNSGAGSAIYGLCSSTSQTGAAVVGINQSIQEGSWGGFFKSIGGTGAYAEANSYDQVGVHGVNSYTGRYGFGVKGVGPGGVWGVATGIDAWGLYTDQSAYIAGGVSPFTGSHIAFTVSNDIEVGDIVEVTSAIAVDVSQSYVEVVSSNSVLSENVFGVATETAENSAAEFLERSGFINDIKHSTDVNNTSVVSYNMKEEYVEYYKEHILANDYKKLNVNSVGEGAVNVCGINGDIKRGNYITSSSIQGKGMKQDDDILHNYTVAKALESVTFSSPEEVKMIACTYHCG